MKTVKFVLLVVLALSAVNVSAQKRKNKKDMAKYYETPTMPVDETSKLITYQGVIQVPGKSADEIYSMLDKWMMGYFKNASKVVKTKDKAKHRIYASPRFRVLNPPDKHGNQLMGGIVKYSMIVETKDGRLRYTLYKFNWQQPSYYPIEKWLDTSAPTYQKRFAYFLQQVDTEANKVINDLKKAIAPKEKKADNW
jgi:hypothetical protein